MGSMRSPLSPLSKSLKTPLQLPKLLAPAGNWDCAKAAVENGADAIYFGLDHFNARMRANNFKEADLPELMQFLHRRGVKGYVTLNTLIFTPELPAVERYLKTVIAAGADAAIVQDVGLCRLIRQISPDFPIHASTQMTITSADGVAFAQQLGCQLVVLARECSLKEINRIQAQLGEAESSVCGDHAGTGLPLEVFVHGALCVAYSGQCLTSEALGGRSANRGECAQACRMTYDLVADGQTVDVGNRQYLLSPQDLSGLPVLPALVEAGVSCLKIEGRLKTPEYVASVTRVYREALDRLVDRPSSAGSQESQGSQGNDREQSIYEPSADETYRLEMAFSRGLYTGWLEGINNQALVHARFGKKRGVYLGHILQVHKEGVTLQPQAPIKAGDGVVFDNGNPQAGEAGGRVYAVQQRGETVFLTFGRRDLDLRQVQQGDKLWKTNDPELDKTVRQSYAGDKPQYQQPITLEVQGAVGQPLVAIARDPQGHLARCDSAMPLVAAHSQPLTTERLRQQLGRLGNTPFCLESLTNHLQGDGMLPVKELNRLRRDLVAQLETQRSQPPRWQLQETLSCASCLPPITAPSPKISPQLIAVVRNQAQLAAAIAADIDTCYCEFENPATYRETVVWFRKQQTRPSQTLWVAPPRITKPLENYILEQVAKSQADGYLVRNYDHLRYFANQRCIGDFSLNVANPLTADYFKTQYGLERLTASYDLNIDQLEALLLQTPAHWFEITLHQHMPLFHMEHCVFCAFLSDGQDFRDCGRPCEKQAVTLRDRTGTEHVLQADAGCRNTLFNGVAQTGAEYAQRLLKAGARYFRIEFLQESPAQVTRILGRYRQLLAGTLTGAQLWRELKLQSQLGVTRGPMDKAHR